ncbi:acid phosphatase-domain-containing protein [Crepidotus variabilis]|uniref:Acid phosphatase-domain-containing protein n=1 Tax=Crepidotus variabilis TaxID=179855 RepID=A0A9P6EII7_9AGAR|nr:acid phosphatase-domain-containing protein [Crepidotus variabilis]
MSFPRLVGLDTDWTIWQGYLNHASWGFGFGAFVPQENNIERVDRWLLRDRTNHNNWIRQYNDISDVIYDIINNHAKLAIVSSSPSKPMSDKALYFLNAINPQTGTEYSIIHLAHYNEVSNESKVNHFRRIRQWSQFDYSEMLMFDDEASNNTVRITLGPATSGTSFHLVRNRTTFTWNLYQEGLAAWRQAKNLTIGLNPGFPQNRVLIGYSGLPTSWINRIYAGEGVVETTTPYRWGFGLYLTSSIMLAKYFRDWNGNWGSDKSYVCQVFVKDYNAWINNVPKIWIPENDGNFPQMNNMNTTAEETALNQENRDAYIATRFGVRAPYALFSQHFYMPNMPLPQGERWTELVAGTQLYRSLFEIVKLEDWQADQIVNPDPYPFGWQFQSWKINVPSVTREEFLRCGEQILFNLSGRDGGTKDSGEGIAPETSPVKETLSEL